MWNTREGPGSCRKAIMTSLLDSEYILKTSYTRHSACRYSTNYHTRSLLLMMLLSRNIALLVPAILAASRPASRFSSSHPAPSKRLVSSTFARWNVCHLYHSSAASQRRGPPPFRCICEANREGGLHFAQNPPAIRPLA